HSAVKYTTPQPASGMRRIHAPGWVSVASQLAPNQAAHRSGAPGVRDASRSRDRAVRSAEIAKPTPTSRAHTVHHGRGDKALISSPVRRWVGSLRPCIKVGPPALRDSIG